MNTMKEDVCIKFHKCPIFQKGILFSEQTGETYKNLYCLKSGKYTECKRYLASEKTGLPVPESILPNSTLSLAEIEDRIRNTKNA